MTCWMLPAARNPRMDRTSDAPTKRNTMEVNLGIGSDSQRTKRTDSSVAATDSNVSCSRTIRLGA